jgi:hypothetical protein
MMDDFIYGTGILICDALKNIGAHKLWASTGCDPTLTDILGYSNENIYGVGIVGLIIAAILLVIIMRS